MRRTPPSAEQTTAAPGLDPEVTCGPGYRAVHVFADRDLGPGSATAVDALHAFLAPGRGAISGTETLTEDQFVRLPEDPDRPREVRFAARRADGSWALVVEILRYSDSRWRDNGVSVCVPDRL